jgi:hypothetical protein
MPMAKPTKETAYYGGPSMNFGLTKLFVAAAALARRWRNNHPICDL